MRQWWPAAWPMTLQRVRPRSLPQPKGSLKQSRVGLKVTVYAMGTSFAPRNFLNTGQPTCPRSNSIPNIHLPALVCRFEDCVANDGGAITVFEGRAVRRYVTVIDYAIEKVRDLMHERMLPPNYVTVGPPVLPKWVVRLSDQHSMEALRFRLNRMLPFSPLISIT